MITRRFLKFLIVGGSNAVLHFFVLNLAYSFLGTSKIMSSVLATIFAMTYSFILNKNFVFRSTTAIRSEVLAFVAVTVSGVLLIHNLIFSGIVYLLSLDNGLVPWLSSIIGGRISHDFIIINLATVVGAVFALLWNYYGYKRFVFTSGEATDEIEKTSA